MAARSNVQVCGRSLDGIAGSNPAAGLMDVSGNCCVLSGRGLCDWPSTHPEEPYQRNGSDCDLKTSTMRMPWYNEISELEKAVDTRRSEAQLGHLYRFLCLDICKHTDLLFHFNLLKPTGHMMHQQFNIQQLYVLPTLYLCVLYLSENKQRLVPLTA